MPKCINCQIDFTIYDEDRAFYAKMDVLEPEECPDCRQQRRIAWRNFTNLYIQKCELTGKSVLTRFNPLSGIKIINVADWHGDKWNPLDYGQDYNVGKPFFEQFTGLYKDVPHYALWQNRSADCDFTNLTTRSNGCYMVFGCVGNENCMYGHIVWESNDCYECLYVRKCELCYEAIDCNESYGLFWCSDCAGCSNCKYCYHCKGCQDCVGCYGIINQKNFVLNQPCSDGQDYQKRAESFLSLTSKERENKILELKMAIPVRGNTILNSVNCTGNYIYCSKNCHNSYDVKECEDNNYGYTLEFIKDAYDCSYTACESELLYNNLTSYGRKIICCQGCLDVCNDIYYCQECNAIKDCFGCVGLHSKEQYCILNKQYSEEEYNKLKAEIINKMRAAGEWGKFFPIKDSPFGYNETMAGEYYPLTKEQAMEKGYNWYDPDSREYQLQSYQVPADIRNVTDEVLQQILACARCERNYKITKQELGFYKKYNLTLPTECFHCRHYRRMVKRNPRKLFERECDYCQKIIRTTYAPDRPERVYCETCYQKEIY